MVPPSQDVAFYENCFHNFKTHNVKYKKVSFIEMKFHKESIQTIGFLLKIVFFEKLPND